MHRKQGIDEVKRLLEAKVLLKKAMTLEELMEEKILESEAGKIPVEFMKRNEEHKHLKVPESLPEVERKAGLFAATGKLALIKESTLLKEMAKGHGITRILSDCIREYGEYQKERYKVNLFMTGNCPPP